MTNFPGCWRLPRANTHPPRPAVSVEGPVTCLHSDVVGQDQPPGGAPPGVCQLGPCCSFFSLTPEETGSCLERLVLNRVEGWCGHSARAPLRAPTRCSPRPPRALGARAPQMLPLSGFHLRTMWSRREREVAGRTGAPSKGPARVPQPSPSWR